MPQYMVVDRWYNPRSPKCRCCVSWGENPDFIRGYEDCQNPDFKSRKSRYHNDPACAKFRLNRGVPLKHTNKYLRQSPEKVDEMIRQSVESSAAIDDRMPLPFSDSLKRHLADKEELDES